MELRQKKLIIFSKFIMTFFLETHVKINLHEIKVNLVESFHMYKLKFIVKIPLWQGAKGEISIFNMTPKHNGNVSYETR